MSEVERKSQKERMVDKMQDSIGLSAVINCGKCDKEDGVEFVEDSIEAAEYFYDLGWRDYNDETLCPSCYKKRKV